MDLNIGFQPQFYHYLHVLTIMDLRIMGMFHIIRDGFYDVKIKQNKVKARKALHFDGHVLPVLHHFVPELSAILL